MNRIPAGVFQAHPVSHVGEASRVLRNDGQAGSVTRFECSLVTHDEPVAARRQHIRRQRHVDACNERQAADVERGRSDVLELDVFQIASLGRVVHDFGDANRRRQDKGRPGQGAPVTSDQGAGLDLDTRCKRNRSAVDHRRRRDGTARLPGITAVHRVVDRPGRGRHRNRKARFEVAARLVEARRLHKWIEFGLPKLFQELAAASREEDLPVKLDLGEPVAVARQWCRADRIAPARGLGNQSGIDLTRPLHVATESAILGQRTVVEQEPMHEIAEEHPVLGVLTKGPQHGARLVVHLELGPVRLVVVEGILGVPGKELERVPRRIQAAGEPVVLIPVRGAGVEVRNHVARQVVDIDQRRKRVVTRLVRNAGARDLVGGVPGVFGAVIDAACLDDVPIVLVAAEMGGGERFIRLLDGVVEPPVQSVQVEMNERPV